MTQINAAQITTAIKTTAVLAVNPKAPCFIKDDDGKFIYLILPVNFNAATN